MAKSDEYRAKADAILKEATRAPSERDRAALRKLADGWLRLAAETFDREAKPNRGGGAES